MVHEYHFSSCNLSFLHWSFCHSVIIHSTIGHFPIGHWSFYHSSFSLQSSSQSAGNWKRKKPVFTKGKIIKLQSSSQSAGNWKNLCPNYQGKFGHNCSLHPKVQGTESNDLLACKWDYFVLLQSSSQSAGNWKSRHLWCPAGKGGNCSLHPKVQGTESIQHRKAMPGFCFIAVFIPKCRELKVRSARSPPLPIPKLQSSSQSAGNKWKWPMNQWPMKNDSCVSRSIYLQE